MFIKNNKNLIIILTSILGALIIIAIFAYSYWYHREEIKLEKEQGAQGEITQAGKEQVEEKKTEDKNNEPSREDSKENVSSDKVGNVDEKTKDWQIYKNTFYNYNIKYPQSWFEGPENREDSWIVYFLNNKVDKISDIDLVEGIKVEILVQGNPRNLSLEDWAREGHLFSGEPKSSNQIAVAGLKAIKEETNFEEEGMSIRVYFFQGDDVYTISYSGAEADYNKYKGDFDSMIDSFNFE